MLQRETTEQIYTFCRNVMNRPGLKARLAQSGYSRECVEWVGQTGLCQKLGVKAQLFEIGSSVEWCSNDVIGALYSIYVRLWIDHTYQLVAGFQNGMTNVETFFSLCSTLLSRSVDCHNRPEKAVHRTAHRNISISSPRCRSSGDYARS